MKKICYFFPSVMMVCIMFLSFTSCTEKETGTYIPTRDEIEHNLVNAGYEYITITDIMRIDGYCITQLSVEKDGEYMAFYWLYTPEQCDTYYDELNEKYPDCDILIKMVNDEKYGCIVFGGTQSAIAAAGIRIVDVKVDIDVKV